MPRRGRPSPKDDLVEAMVELLSRLDHKKGNQEVQLRMHEDIVWHDTQQILGRSVEVTIAYDNVIYRLLLGRTNQRLTDTEEPED